MENRKKGSEKRQEMSGAIDKETVMSVALDFEQGRIHGPKVARWTLQTEERTDRRTGSPSCRAATSRPAQRLVMRPLVGFT